MKPMPPLFGADLRVKRAKQLIRALERRIEGWAGAHRQYFGVVYDAAGKPYIGLTKADEARLGRISVNVGETLYNLRAALDYTIHELSRDPDTGEAAEGTQFPIEESKKKFKMRVTGLDADGKPVESGHFLKGVPDTAVQRIRRLQPFYGCKWTRTLRNLSNPDKHQHLSPMRSSAAIQLTRQEVVSVDPKTNKGSVNVYFDAEVEVFFADGRPVLETLQMLCREVEATVALFKTGIKSN
jgi:hypothetical protein